LSSLFNAALYSGEAAKANFSLWYDMTGARTHDLPHSRQSHWSLHHCYKTDCHDIAEILLKVALNTITLTLFLEFLVFFKELHKL
jgi:hypothetical protein